MKLGLSLEIDELESNTITAEQIIKGAQDLAAALIAEKKLNPGSAMLYRESYTRPKTLKSGFRHHVKIP